MYITYTQLNSSTKHSLLHVSGLLYSGVHLVACQCKSEYMNYILNFTLSILNFNNCSFTTFIFYTKECMPATVFNNDLVIAALKMEIIRRNMSG